MSVYQKVVGLKVKYIELGGKPIRPDYNEWVVNSVLPGHEDYWQWLLPHGFMEIHKELFNLEEFSKEATFYWVYCRGHILSDMMNEFCAMLQLPDLDLDLDWDLTPEMRLIAQEALRVDTNSVLRERVEILPGEKAHIYGIEGYGENNEPLVLEATQFKSLGVLIYEHIFT